MSRHQNLLSCIHIIVSHRQRSETSIHTGPDTTTGSIDVGTYADMIAKHSIPDSKKYELLTSQQVSAQELTTIFLKVLINVNSSISGFVSLSHG